MKSALACLNGQFAPNQHNLSNPSITLTSTDVPGRADADAGVDARAAQVARLGAAEGEGE